MSIRNGDVKAIFRKCRLSYQLFYEHDSYYDLMGKDEKDSENNLKKIFMDYFSGILFFIFAQINYYTMTFFLFLISFISFLLFSRKLDASIRSLAKDYALIYIDLPNAGFYKFLEGMHFKKHITSGEKLMEIGAEEGTASKMHFSHIKSLFLASELVFSLFRVNKNLGYKNRIVSDVTQLPLGDSTIRDIAMVHVVDHIENVSTAYTEVGRVVNRDFVFSGHSSYWLNILFLSCPTISKKKRIKFANKYMHNYNFYNSKIIEQDIIAHGFELKTYNEFSKGFLGGLNDLIHIYFFKDIASHPWRILTKIHIFKKMLLFLLHCYFLFGYVNDLLLSPNARGVHFFAVAKKVDR